MNNPRIKHPINETNSTRKWGKIFGLSSRLLSRPRTLLHTDLSLSSNSPPPFRRALSSTIKFAARAQSRARFSTCSDNSRLFFLPSGRPDFHGKFKFSVKQFISSQTALNLDAKCWNCNAAAEAAPFLVCLSCRCIQPVDQSVDYFQIFGIFFF